MRAALRAQRGGVQRAEVAAPSKRTRPAVGSISRSTSRPSVDLPQPDSPTTPSVSPGRSVRSTPSTARTAPLARPNSRAHREVLDQALALAAAARRSCGRLPAEPRPAAHRGRAAPASRPARWRVARPSRQRRRVASAQRASANGQRGGEAAAGRAAQRVGHLALDRGQPRAARRAAAGSSRAARRCRDAAARANSARHRRLLDDAAGVHHRHLVGRSRPPRRGRA